HALVAPLRRCARNGKRIDTASITTALRRGKVMQQILEWGISFASPETGLATCLASRLEHHAGVHGKAIRRCPSNDGAHSALRWAARLRFTARAPIPCR